MGCHAAQRAYGGSVDEQEDEYNALKVGVFHHEKLGLRFSQVFEEIIKRQLLNN